MKKTIMIINMIVLTVLLAMVMTGCGQKQESSNSSAQSSNSAQSSGGAQSSNSAQSSSSVQSSGSAKSSGSVQSSAGTATVVDGVQSVTTKMTSGGYPAITVQKGVPVKWTIQAEASNLNGCNNNIIIPKYNISKKLVAGDNVIEFTPTESGTVSFSCWMGMIRSTITVVDDINNIPKQAQGNTDSAEASNAGGCCAQ